MKEKGIDRNKYTRHEGRKERNEEEVPSQYVRWNLNLWC
jgi:hypothetical protein